MTKCLHVRVICRYDELRAIGLSSSISELLSGKVFAVHKIGEINGRRAVWLQNPMMKHLWIWVYEDMVQKVDW